MNPSRMTEFPLTSNTHGQSDWLENDETPHAIQSDRLNCHKPRSCDNIATDRPILKPYETLPPGSSTSAESKFVNALKGNYETAKVMSPWKSPTHLTSSPNHSPKTPNTRLSVASTIKRFERLHALPRNSPEKTSFEPTPAPSKPASRLDRNHNDRYFSGFLSEQEDSLLVQDDDDSGFTSAATTADSPPADTARNSSKAQKLLGLTLSDPLYISSQSQSQSPPVRCPVFCEKEDREVDDSLVVLASISTFSPFGGDDLNSSSPDLAWIPYSSAELDFQPNQPSLEGECGESMPADERPPAFQEADLWRKVTYKHGPLTPYFLADRNAGLMLAGSGNQLPDSLSVTDEVWIDSIVDEFSPLLFPPITAGS